jgi:hypothetical protein
MSLYEVSDIVRDTSFRARDLVRGGEPVLISERSATRSVKQWDRIATRVVQVGSRTQISGGLPLRRIRHAARASDRSCFRDFRNRLLAVVWISVIGTFIIKRVAWCRRFNPGVSR